MQHQPSQIQIESQVIFKIQQRQIKYLVELETSKFLKFIRLRQKDVNNLKIKTSTLCWSVNISMICKFTCFFIRCETLKNIFEYYADAQVTVILVEQKIGHIIIQLTNIDAITLLYKGK